MIVSILRGLNGEREPLPDVFVYDSDGVSGVGGGAGGWLGEGVSPAGADFRSDWLDKCASTDPTPPSFWVTQTSELPLLLVRTH
jgi:hypothetical protein